MITDKVFEWFGAACRFVLGLLPDWSLPDLSADVEGFYDRIQPHANLLAWLNLFVPLREALLLLSLGLLMWLAAHVYRVGLFVLTKLHVTGGGA